MLWPLPVSFTRITQGFGENPADYVSTGGHPGLDISCPIGTPVLAAFDGLVRYEHTKMGGWVVRLVGDSYIARFCHLNSYTAADGENVKAGAEIARSGNSGTFTTGPHLHFEIRNFAGSPLDPLARLEVPIVSKLSLHFQATPEWSRELVARCWPSPAWVKVINPPVPDVYPQTKILGRAMFHGADNDAWERSLVEKGAAGGHEYFQFMRPYYEARRGIVTLWEAVNEPDVSTPDRARLYAAWLGALVDDASRIKIPICGGSFGRGIPQVRTADPDSEILKILAPVLVRCAAWSYHAYWYHRFDPADDWSALRYRRIFDECAALGYSLPECHLSEFGCDNGGGRLDGYRDEPEYGGSFEKYFGDLVLASNAIAGDPRVRAAYIFTCAPDQLWFSFGLDERQAGSVGAFVSGDVPVISTPAPAGLPEHETSSDPGIIGEKIRWWLEEQLREIEAGNLGRATEIGLSNIKLGYRLERVLKGQ